MKLLSLRLHPFGGTIDRTYKFSEKIQVLEGANEYGKSTFRVALSHALFTLTKLTPVKQTEILGPWFPKNGGDYVQITLCLTYDGKTYQIKKRWGSQSSCSIINETDRIEIADQNAVSSKIEQILGHNQATWENVFITQQDSIRSTIESLKKNLPIVQAAGIEILVNDVNPQTLETEINSKLKKIEGNWDSDQQAPKKDNQNNSRGIDNKWLKGAGEILKAWYEWKDAEKCLQDRISYDFEVDRINGEMQTNDQVISSLTPIIEQGRKIRDTVYQRQALESELSVLKNQLDELSKCCSDWPVFENQYTLNVIELGIKEKLINELKQELENAIMRAESASLLETLQKIGDLEKDISEKVQKESNIKKVDDKKLQDLVNIETEVRDLDLQIKAQSLVATLNSSKNFSLTVTNGTDAPREIYLVAGIEQKVEASGKIQIQGHELTIAVRSSQADIESLISELISKEKEKKDLLLDLDFCLLQDVKNAAEAEKNIKREIEKKREMLEQALGTRTKVEWEELRAKVENLPQVRSREVITGLQQKTQDEKAQIEAKQEVLKLSIDDWKSKWKDQPGLLKEVIRIGGLVNNKNQELAVLPELPGGFGSTEEFKEKFILDSENLEKAKNTKLYLQEEFGKLSQSETKDIQELTEIKDEKLDNFYREDAWGKALKRILAVIKNLRGEVDPYLGLAERIRYNFNILTDGKYMQLDHENGLPIQVGTNAITLETALLSQGTMTSLALAVRLSLAELYLEKSKAFIVMDDPFVDLDSSRREAGINLLRNLGEKTQIIYLTCHSNHAAEITPNRVEVKDA